jgi:hypothetical protein
MHFKHSLALPLLCSLALLSACAFPKETELGKALRITSEKQQVSNGAEAFKNSAYEMQRGMNSYYGGRSAPKPMGPSLKAGNSDNSPEN